MIRPEAKAQLWRWREVIAGVTSAVLGLWWLTHNSALLYLPAAALIISGAALIWMGVQRARFRGAGQGPGTVQVNEGQIAYFGPLTGGVLALAELVEIKLDGTQYPPHWHLKHGGAEALLIPVNADGADKLFDAFASLPGLRTDRMLAALDAVQDRTIVIWTRELSMPARRSLH